MIYHLLKYDNASERSEREKMCADFLSIRFIQPLYSFLPLILRIFSCRTQNLAYAYHLHFRWRTAYQGSAYRIPSKKVGIRRTKKGGYSLMIHDFCRFQQGLRKTLVPNILICCAFIFLHSFRSKFAFTRGQM